MTERSSTLRLVIDTSSGRTAKETLRDVKTEAREAGQAVDKLGDESKESARDIERLRNSAVGLAKGLGTIVGAAVGAAAVLTFKDAIKSAAEAEQAYAQLAAAVKSTGGTAKRTVEDLVALSAQIQRTSLLGDDQVQIAAANLLTFTNIVGDAFDKTLVAATNVSQRIGQDLVSTTLQLGKALNDPVANLGALSRSGIQFSEAQTEMIKGLVETNRLAEAQSIILGELETQFGGAAQAARDTFGGAATAAKNAYGDLLEILGGAGTAQATDDLNELADALASDQTIANVEFLAELLSGVFEGFIQGANEALSVFNRFFDDVRKRGPIFDFLDPNATEKSLKIIEDRLGQVTTNIDIIGPSKKLLDEQARLNDLADQYRQILNGTLSPAASFSLTSDDILATWNGIKAGSKDTSDNIGLSAEEAKKLAAAAEKVRAAFADQVVVPFQDAKALFEAAQISEEALDAKREELQIQRQLNDLAAEFAEAGLSFDRAAAEAMLEQTAALEKATDALIDAQRKVRDETAKGFEASIDQAFARFGGIDFTRTPEGAIGSIFSDVDRTVGNLLKTLDQLEPLLDDDQIADLRRVILDGSDKIKKGVVEGATEGAKRMREEIAGAVGGLLDDLIFNGGRGFDDFFRSFGRDVANDVLIDPLSKAFAGDGDIIGNIKGAFEDFNTKFQRVGEAIFGKGATGQFAGRALAGAGAGLAGFQVGTGLSNLLGITGNRASQLAGGAAGGGIGFAVAGPIGAAVGAALGNIFGGLFSKPSDNAAGGGVNFKTFSPENQFAKNNDPETIAARNELLSATATLAQTLAELTGSNFAGPGISIQVGKRDGTVIQSSAGGSVTTAVGDAQAALDEIFRQLVVSLRGGEKALVDYALAAQKAGRAPDDVIQGLQSLKAIFDLTAEPLSQVEQALKAIDDTVNPVIEDLKSLGLSIANISKVADDAAKAVGKAFIDDIQHQILDAQNGVLGDYKRLVDQIQQRQKDALTLFQRGAITQGELESVQFLGALQTRNFFEGLTPEELASLGDYFGLIGDEIGQTQAALAKLELGITDFVDNVVETVDRLKREAEAIQDAVDRALQTRDDILRRFSPLLPGEQLTDLRGQLGQILQDIKDPTATAEFIADQTNLASDLAKQFVDLSAQIFGPTAQFAQNRDFATGILEQIAVVGQEQVDERLTLIEVAEREVAILQEIRDVIASPDPSIPFIQQVLDENRVTNTILTDLLTQYIAAATAQATVLNSQTARTAADSFLASQGLTQQPANTNTSAGTQALVDTFIRENQKLQADNQKLQASLNSLVGLMTSNNNDQRALLDLTRAASSFR